MRNTNLSVLAAITGIVIFFMAGGESGAQQIGVLGLYDVDKGSSVTIDERKIGDIGCRLRLSGFVASESGDINIDKPNRFVFLACAGPLLGDAAKRSVLSNLVSSGRALAMLEGTLTDTPDSKTASAVESRQYVLKISYYNNLDTDVRERDLELANQAANTRPDNFVTESFISVNRALGMPTPDEVVVLFYDSPSHGDRFRKNNPDVMRMIGGFNKAHLNDFIYYVGQATR